MSNPTLWLVYIFGVSFAITLYTTFSVYPQIVRYVKASFVDEKKEEARQLLAELGEAVSVSFLWPIFVVVFPFYCLGKVIKTAYF